MEFRHSSVVLLSAFITEQLHFSEKSSQTLCPKQFHGTLVFLTRGERSIWGEWCFLYKNNNMNLGKKYALFFFSAYIIKDESHHFNGLLLEEQKLLQKTLFSMGEGRSQMHNWKPVLMKPAGSSIHPPVHGLCVPQITNCRCRISLKNFMLGESPLYE